MPSGARPPRSATWRPIIAGDKTLSWAYTEEFIEEDEPTRQARMRAEELGVQAVPAGTGAALRVLAAASRAHAVAEVGTGTGVSGLWLLQGMVPDGVLTTIDVEPEHQQAARQAFAAAGVRTPRARLISGRALAVLPRLADGAYDMVVVDGDPAEATDCVELAVRLLRPGGVLAVTAALWHDRVADPARRDEATVAVRELGKAVRADDRLLSALLPTGDGLLVAVRR
ncbi:class I SAM-dependent methyltransferase [Georgenia sp. 10Sc9-8]|uniref:Class I SAM-dependent methyltransferase n=1 Tax=Georgenia halotolerans TaxID=3028317 RepID=A0ABT5TVM8_9MICO|nr:class I SAM-dependent methyltransferase [Georgenia halotolerans]